MDHAPSQPTPAVEVSESVNGHDGGKPDVKDSTLNTENQRHVSNHPDLLTTANDRANGAPAPEKAVSAEATTTVDRSNSTREEDVDPFSYRPPYTKWDYIKVHILSSSHSGTPLYSRHSPLGHDKVS